MKVDYSREFEKSLKKMSGKMLDSVRRVIIEVKQAQDIKTRWCNSSIEALGF